MQLDSSNLKNEEKKLKRYQEEQKELKKIIKHIKFCNNYTDLRLNPLSKIYGFEELKHELNGYNSFRLGKSGVIRLIVTVDEKENIIKIVFISMNHYEDFKRKLRKGL